MTFEENTKGLHFEIKNLPSVEDIFFEMSFSPAKNIDVSYRKIITDNDRTFGINLDVPYFFPEKESKIAANVCVPNGFGGYIPIIQRCVTLPFASVESYSDFLDTSVSIENNPENKEVIVSIKDFPSSLETTDMCRLSISLKDNIYTGVSLGKYFKDGKAVIPYSDLTNNEEEMKKYAEYTTPKAEISFYTTYNNLPVKYEGTWNNYFRIDIKSESL